MLPWNSFPFNEEMKKMLANKDGGSIDKYVQDMISKMLPQNMEGMMNPENWMNGMQNNNQESSQKTQQTQTPELQAAIFETHDFVFVRIPIKDENWLKDMKIFHTSHEIIIENIPELSNKITYSLPAPVRKKGATAIHKDQILEIRIPRSIPSQISEISIHDT